ncbi:MAG TPA: DUF4292 domain-containing protein [Bacteroidales bacterium]|nr:DUF4292 domain-containing protein [Bacteroidales bacterium]HOX74167.1 DUF4292 domain-containing protein [Bacteroidales bacterium]HPM88066.1 DUF4292 domain-containing protein [Bacteroidales bacterium]HQM67881.1 DUF4292 domain-containing protein [Bacteroidales bacterium]
MSWKEIILIVTVILSGCTAVRKANVTIPAVRNVENDMSLTERIIGSNLTAKDFNILKANVEVINNGEEQKLIASIKYRRNGNYLVTIRNRSGIEAARAMVTSDTVLINDRIYRRLYCGSSDYLSNKYGVSADLLPLVFGDYLDGLTETEVLKDCSNGTSEIQGYHHNKELWYSLDCKSAKVTSVTVSEKYGTAGINMKFGNFKSEGNSLYPGRISLEDVSGKTKILIEIISIDFADQRELEFISGRNYERIILK